VHLGKPALAHANLDADVEMRSSNLAGTDRVPVKGQKFTVVLSEDVEVRQEALYPSICVLDDHELLGNRYGETRRTTEWNGVAVVEDNRSWLGGRKMRPACDDVRTGHARESPRDVRPVTLGYLLRAIGPQGAAASRRA
jgi:hypothetical protein